MTLLLLVSLAVALMAETLASAPEGYEDASGFHYGRKPLQNEEL